MARERDVYKRQIYMGPNGEAMKAFSIKDGYVVNYILKPAGIKPVIITKVGDHTFLLIGQP